MKVIKFDQFLNEGITIDELEKSKSVPLWHYNDFDHEFKVFGGDIKINDLVGVFFNEDEEDEDDFIDDDGVRTKHGLMSYIFIAGEVIDDYDGDTRIYVKNSKIGGSRVGIYYEAYSCRKLQLKGEDEDELKHFISYRRRKKE